MGRKSLKNSPKKQATSTKTMTKPAKGQPPSSPALKKSTKATNMEDKTAETLEATAAVVGQTKVTQPDEQESAADSTKNIAHESEEPATGDVVKGGKAKGGKAKRRKSKGSKSKVDDAKGEGKSGEKKKMKIRWNYDVDLHRLIELLECPYYVAEHDKAVTTFELLEGVVAEDDKWKTVRELLDRIMAINAELIIKVPHETTPRNVIFKLKKTIVDEYQLAIKDFVGNPDIRSAADYFRSLSIQNAVTMDLPTLPDGLDPLVVAAKVKEAAIVAMNEYKTELENIPDLIAKQGRKIISNGDHIMTYAYCPTTTRLFIEAAKRCKFTLYVVESQPLCYGHLILDQIGDNKNIETVMIADVNIYTLMPMMTKVIMPCVAVLFNGSLKTIAFGGVLSTIAEMNQKEVYAVAATYQFTLPVVGNKNLDLGAEFIDDNPFPNVEYICQKFDLTECSTVSKIVTNNAKFPTSQTQRHMAELYTPRHEKDEKPVQDKDDESEDNNEEKKKDEESSSDEDSSSEESNEEGSDEDSNHEAT